MNNHNPSERVRAEHGRSEHGTRQRPAMAGGPVPSYTFIFRAYDAYFLGRSASLNGYYYKRLWLTAEEVGQEMGGN